MKRSSVSSAVTQAVLLFLANGLLLGSWATAIPGLARRLDLGEGRLAVVLLGLATGGIAMMIAAPRLIGRVGHRPLSRISGVLSAFAFILPLTAPSWLTAIGATLFMGAVMGCMDIAMNTEAVVVEQRRGRPILSRLHGCFSIGALAGSLFGGLLIEAGVGQLGHGLATALLAGLVVVPTCIVRPDTVIDPVATQERPHGNNLRDALAALTLLAFIAFAGLVCEGAMIDWTVKLMRQYGEAPLAAAAVYGAFAGGMAVGRLSGDSFTLRIGDRVLLVAGCLIAAGGVGVMILSVRAAIALPAMLLAGLGVANIVPVVFRLAGAHGSNPASSLAFVTICAYCGLLVGPVAIGSIAEWTGLRLALFFVVAALLSAALAGRLRSVLTHGSASGNQQFVPVESTL